MTTPRVLVLGAGIGGLTMALDLARAGLRPTVLEAAARPGGVISTHTVGGLILDAGARTPGQGLSLIHI